MLVAIFSSEDRKFVNVPPCQRSYPLRSVLKDEQFCTCFENSLLGIATGNQIEPTKIMVNQHLVISNAKRDLELAMRQFDFEKFRNALYNQKDKFFIAIRDVFSKIYSQVIGIPISITAALSTTYKTENTYAVLLLTLVSFLVYVVIYTIIQCNYYKDIKEIQIDFLWDFSIIKTQSGLPVADVTKKYDKVDRKINMAIRIAISLMAAGIILGIVVIVFILLQLRKFSPYNFRLLNL